MLIDSHCHIARALTGFWQPLRYGKVFDQGQERQGLPPSFDPPASPPEVLLGYMDQVGVDRAFLVQHHMYGNQNADVLEAIRSWPDRFVGFAYLGAFDRLDVADELERLISDGMLGLKVEVTSTRRLRADFRFDGEREWQVWERLNQLKRPLALDLITATPEDVVALRRVIDTFDRIQIVNCHVGGPPGAGWQERALLTRHARGWVDLAALPLLIDREDEYPFVKAQEMVRWAVETFGADRVMWGTDYPPTLNYATYRQLLDWVRRHCQFLTAEQKDLICGGTAERFLRTIG
jgi:predicted TIM-barrel fold metal-dependent hydrolase